VTEGDDRTRLRATFDSAAERYDRIRPRYLTAVFDDIERLGGLAPGSRVMEVGCGTGQATVDLATRGYDVVAVEIGAELAAIASRRLAAFPRADVIVADFERWELPIEPFDAVVAATAFHWIDPEIRFLKAADALRPGGPLAIVDTDHVAGGTEQFFVDVQDCYERWDPKTEPGLRLPAAADMEANVDEVARSGRFGPVIVCRYEWEQTYSTSGYRDLLLTYSGHLALERPARTGLLDCIEALIDNRYGRFITKRYLTTLRLAHRPGDLLGRRSQANDWAGIPSE
jgi:SAM-dependent methyltransferase